MKTKYLFIICILLALEYAVALPAKVYIDKTVRPQNNFYLHTNGEWLKKSADEKADTGIHQNALFQLNRQITRCLNTKIAKDENIYNLYISFMDRTEKTRLSRTALIDEQFRKIDAITDVEQMQKIAADLNKIGVKLFVDVGASYDFSSPEKLSAIVSVHQYPNIITKKEDVNKVIRSVLKVDLDPKIIASMVDIENEIKIIANMPPSNTLLKISSIPPADLQENGWNAYFTFFGIDPNITNIYFLHDSQFKALNELFKKYTIEQFKDYLRYKFLLDYNDVLSYAGNDRGIDYDRSVAYDIIKKHFANEVIYLCFHQLVEETTPEILKIFGNVQNAYGRYIDQSAWMSPEAKQNVKEKLFSISVLIGYLAKPEGYPVLHIAPDDPAGNIKRIEAFKHASDIKQFYNYNTVGYQLEVNYKGFARYNGLMNKITIPLVYLMPAYFEQKADDEFNYGIIGATIGHETYHAFDSANRHLNGNKQVRACFNDKECRELDAIGNNLVSQYGSEPATINENMADLFGVRMAYNAFWEILKGKPKAEIKNRNMNFYYGYAESFRELENPDDLRHSKPSTRVNFTLRNESGFYEAFDVKKGDGMFLVPDKRANIWQGTQAVAD